jgi:hypothetical protein
LVASEDHVGDIFVDGSEEDVEDRVVGGLPSRVGRSSGDGAVDVVEVAHTTEGGLHVDRPLGVVANGEGEDDGADVTGCTTQGDGASGKGAGLRGDNGPGVGGGIEERGERHGGQQRWVKAAAHWWRRRPRFSGG